jgi:hypothetical protein
MCIYIYIYIYLLFVVRTFYELKLSAHSCCSYVYEHMDVDAKPHCNAHICTYVYVCAHCAFLGTHEYCISHN